jgi:hypothetical protein
VGQSVKAALGVLLMSKNKIECNWSDAWLLLAIIYAGSGGANLERIIGLLQRVMVLITPSLIQMNWRVV